MIQFVTAAILYLALMFVVLICISFVTIGIAYAFARFIKRYTHRVRSPQLVLK